MTERCGAKTRGLGTPCALPPAKGATRCRFHGGATPNSRRAAKQRLATAEAEKAVRTFGLPVEVDPADALLEEVHRTAGHVAYLHNVVGDLEHDSLRQYANVGEGGGHWDVSVWVKLYQAERAHLVSVCKAAISAGIEERRVRLAESQGELFGELLRVAIHAIGATPEQEAAAYDAVRGRLQLVRPA